ncbi:hypothetical protein JCM10207_001922 [Rhodosporidiobolus poonsookiae]
MIPPTSNIFKPLKVGNLTLSTRVVMAPMTRIRADEKHVVHDVHATYYSQRGSTPGTLVLSEATLANPSTGVMGNVPGIFTDEQVQGWRKVVDAVHAKGSFIFLQIAGLGRAAPAEAARNETGGDVVGPGDIPMEGGATPRPMTLDEIKETVSHFAEAAKRFVKEAGGDGVELHNANGYLLDQFLQTNSNNRTDEYGGSAENRARFTLELVDAVSKAVGEERTAIRLSPFSTFQGMKMPLPDIQETFSYLVDQLVKHHPSLAYLHCVEPRLRGYDIVEVPAEENLEFLQDAWSPRPFFRSGGYTDEDGPELADKYDNVAIVYGRAFLSNPDLVRRLKEGIPLTPCDHSTFYLPGPVFTKGYTDYPFAE